MTEFETSLHAEIARLREETEHYTNRESRIASKRMHEKAVELLGEKVLQIQALKGKVCELNHRLFGQKIERSKEAKLVSELIGGKGKQGQQKGSSGKFMFRILLARLWIHEGCRVLIRKKSHHGNNKLCA